MSELSPLLAAQQKFIDAINAGASGSENVSLTQALGRTLAQPLQAQEDAPAYHRAIVEGFVVHAAATQGASEENPISFKIIGNVRPGDALCPSLTPGEAVEVSTGAIVADGPHLAVDLPGGGGKVTRFFDAEAGTEIDPVTIDRATGAPVGTRPIRIAAPE